MGNSNNNDAEDTKEDLFLSFFDAWNDYKFDRDDKELKKHLLNQAILNAYDDATRQGAYNTKIGKEEELLQARSAEAQGECVKYLLGNKEHKGAVEELLKAKDGYNTKHREVCKHLCDEHMKENENGINLPFFTFGNAQKWVNMTMKYLYVYASFLDEMVDIRDNNPFQCILNLKSELHIPLDRYIIKAVFNKETRTALIESTKDEEELINKNIDDSFNFANSEGQLHFSKDGAEITPGSQLCRVGEHNALYIAWSNISHYKNYETVQDAIKQCIPCDADGKILMSPLEWENKVWLAVSALGQNNANQAN